MFDRMRPEREKRIREVAARRQSDLTVLLENVHDPHNIFAVMRSCDAVGIEEIFVIDPEGHFKTGGKGGTFGKRASASARKWVEIRRYETVEECVKAVRKRYERLFGTHLTEDSKSLYELDLSASVALVFGNESQGISAELQSHMDGNFLIPQVGMIQSLNISVACAVCLYEAFRQRDAIGKYDSPQRPDTELEALVQRWKEK